MKSDVRTVELLLHDLPYQGLCPNGNTHRPNEFSYLPIYVFWKEILQFVEH
jgi:hypothetical protein